MALLDNTTQRGYYQGDDHGNYQFVSLEDIINQFMVVYIGEDKIISKAKRVDVAFHAQRAMQEFSFDTFKSIKSQEIVLPPSLTMMLPHDYVNYTKLSWADDAGVKRILYPTSMTSNPFKIKQDSNKNYDFAIDGDVLFPNSDFSSNLNSLTDWNQSPNHGSANGDTQGVVNGQLEFFHNSISLSGTVSSRHYAVWQELDVTGLETITLTAEGLSSASGTNKDAGIVRVGVSTLVTGPGSQTWNATSGITGYDPGRTNPNINNKSRNGDIDIFNLFTLSGDSSYIEFNSGNGALTSGTVTDIDVSGETSVFLLITSNGGQHTSTSADTGTNAVDNITMTFDDSSDNLQSAGESTTWSRFKSHSPQDLKTDDYEYDDDIFNTYEGQRYGLDPAHAQANGSFFIDNLKGLIHFSSNISGKTVILDYISDSLGTEAEMKVHKFAEEAMYKWIAHAILSNKTNTPEFIIQRFKKERFAAIRNAKLRLSNIKLHELTRILRGKSKHIKH
jgi:hypothetical protein